MYNRYLYKYKVLLFLFLPGIKIDVTDTDDTCVTLDVSPAYLVSDVKNVIKQNKEDFEEDFSMFKFDQVQPNQYNQYRKSFEQLDDDKTLRSYKIENKRTLEIGEFSSSFVNTFDKIPAFDRLPNP